MLIFHFNLMFVLLLEIKKEVDNAKVQSCSNSLPTEMIKKYEDAFEEIIKTGLKDNLYKPKDLHKRGRLKQITIRILKPQTLHENLWMFSHLYRCRPR